MMNELDFGMTEELWWAVKDVFEDSLRITLDTLLWPSQSENEALDEDLVELETL